MPRKRFDHAVVDELERELREALTLEPSPDFGRQVRARIAQPPVRFLPAFSGWRVGLAAAAACVLVAMTAGGLMPAREEAASMTPAARGGRDVQLRELRPEADAPPAYALVGAGAGQRRSAKQSTTVRARAVSPPEVLVPEDNARALSRLIALVRSGAIDEDRLTPIAPTPGPASLAVAPLVVPLLPATKIDQTGTARGGARE